MADESMEQQADRLHPPRNRRRRVRDEDALYANRDGTIKRDQINSIKSNGKGSRIARGTEYLRDATVAKASSRGKTATVVAPKGPVSKKPYAISRRGKSVYVP